MAVLKSELNYTSAHVHVPAALTKDKLLLRHIDSRTKSNFKIDKIDLPTFYLFPKLHKNPYKSRFISNSSHCSTTFLYKHIISPLTAVKDRAVKYSETAFGNSNVNYFGPPKLFQGQQNVAVAELSGFSSIFFGFFYIIRFLAT